MGGTCSTNAVASDDSSINAADKKNIRSTWAKLYKNWEVTGKEFYLRVFNNLPDMKKTFKTFSTMSDDELSVDATFSAHVLVVGTTINNWINTLDDTETLVALIQKLTDSHVIRGIKDKPMFKAIVEELLTYMSEKLKLTPAQVSSWNKLIEVLCSVINQRIDDLS